ncbi:putative Fibroblast growth factor receptor [Hypsibius exemplaris]|uniref:Fibroblast growth factor receptor n=1 Tax=Hypsibius exemplaris TaxID=2072580 RepID=A0A1W0WE77_HYPEX|nr:putative Fibroblast growth factor receptor [Hypsibius exemplaris]
MSLWIWLFAPLLYAAGATFIPQSRDFSVTSTPVLPDGCPPILSREEWGSRYPAPTAPLLAKPVARVYLLQTLYRNCVDLPTCKLQARNAERDHTHLNWGSIGYNFMVGIDSNGSLFEGRGFFVQSQYPETSESPKPTSYAVAFLGNFSSLHSLVPRREALESVLRLLNCAISQDLLSADYAVRRYNTNQETVDAFNLIRNITSLPTVVITTSSTSFGTSSASSSTSFETSSASSSTSFETSSASYSASPPTSSVQSSTPWEGHFNDQWVSSPDETGIADKSPNQLFSCASVMNTEIFAIPFASHNHDRRISFRCWMRPSPLCFDIFFVEETGQKNGKDEFNELGNGHFGVVLKARLREHRLRGMRKASTEEVDVAVKMLRDDIAEKDKSGQQKAFLMEMEMLLKVGRHVNIVNLIGVVLEEQPMIVMEYCCLGSLYEFLRDDQHTRCFFTDQLPPQVDTYAVHGVDDLINFGFQVCRGMEFVSGRGVIHRDLAARNILLDSRKVAKIADFGLAREQMEYSLVGKNTELPWRWLAIETLAARQGVFSTKSDVWSFGVTLWEILSLCRQLPYRTEQNGKVGCGQLHDFLTSGQRLSRPELSTVEMYAVMKCCWAADPQDRPSFTEIARMLSAFLPESMQHEYLEVDQTNNVYNKLLDQEYRCSTDL